MTGARERYSLKGLARQLGLDPELLELLAEDTATHYRPFTVQASRGKLRQIDNPDEALKLVQRRLRKAILQPLPLPEHVHGCVKKRSQLSNASVHLGRPNLSSVDVKNFYPSITNSMIFDLWRYLGFGHRLASLLTKLTTGHGHLPQGAPTSDALANHAMRPTDLAILAIANRRGLGLSRYLDNIDISGPRAWEAITEVISVLRAQGLAVRHSKVFSAGANRPQVVTGLTVNNGRKPSVSRLQQRQIRSAVHEFILARSKNPASRLIQEEQRLRGRLAYLHQMNSGAARRLDRQLAEAGIEFR